jgi:hypothetical protein
MSTPQEKCDMKKLGFYKEIHSCSKHILYEKVQFLGLEYIGNNLFLRFQLVNGKHFRRLVNDEYFTYEPNNN